MARSQHDSKRPFNEERLFALTGIVFKNKRLARQAFTHSSYVNEHQLPALENNERLEFLGDAVLELCVSNFLYSYFPEKNEGELTKLRAEIVCEPSLVSFAEALSFNEFVLLGKGEEAAGGRRRPALLADVFEAFVGALYLDRGIEAVERWLDGIIYEKVRKGAFSHGSDYKTRLQERVQRSHGGRLEYRLAGTSGPAHRQIFRSQVLYNGKVIGVGEGRTKKEAEQQAAKKALETM